MKLSRVYIQGWRSFQGEQCFDLTKLTPGLYHVHGRNELRPELEGNGVGKSNLFEAINWCFYGRTSRRQHGNSLKNWFYKHQSYVVCELETAAGLVTVLRQQGPNKLEISVNNETPREREQAELERLLCMSLEAFQYGIYHSQFEPRFLDLQPTKQMQIFSSVRGLDLWERASAQASARARALELEVNTLREKLARLEGQAQSLVELSYDKEEVEWQVTHDRTVRDFAKQIKEAEALRKQFKASVDKHRKGSEEFRRRRDKVQAAALEVTKHGHEERSLDKQLHELKRKDLKKCPTCGAALKDDGHLKKEILRIEKDLLKAQLNVQTCLEHHDKLMREMVEYREEEKKLLDAEKAYVKEEEHLAGLIRQHKAMTTNIVNPFTVKKQEQQALAEKLQKDLEDTEARLSATEVDHKNSQYWTGGFKQVRLMLIKESLAQLQVEANEALYQIGLRDWELGFDVERETKSGTIDRNFTVSVKAPGLKDPQPWEAWCGGETQRLRLAGMFGFANLICGALGVQPNIELVDEPTAWVSGKGVHDLLEILAARAQQQQKIILLADHRVLDSGAFTGTINIVHDKNGSRIEL